MKRWSFLAPLLLATGCSIGGTQTQTVSVIQADGVTTRTVTTSTSEPVAFGIRGHLAPAGAFYMAAPDVLCAIAEAAVLYERDRGTAAPIAGLFYDKGIAIGPDCTGTYAAAGLPPAVPGNGDTRHVSMPRQAVDDGVDVGVDYGCSSDTLCLGGNTYRLYRHRGAWRVDPGKTVTWIR